MLKPAVRKTYDGMGEFLADKWYDDEIDPDDWHRDWETGYGFAMFGRRVIEDVEGQGIDYTRHATIADACEQMQRLHHDRPPCEFDAIVSSDGGDYFASLEGVAVDGSWPCERLAHRALAQAMTDAGCFPDAFWTERGDWRRIDDDVREFHDAGGTDMLPDPLEGWRFASDGMVYEITASTATTGHLHDWGDVERSGIAGTPHHTCQTCGTVTLLGDLRADIDDGSILDGVELAAVAVGDDRVVLFEMGDIRANAGRFLLDGEEICECGQDGCQWGEWCSEDN